VSVDFGVLDSPAIRECVDAEAETLATEILAEAGVITAGTTEWGDQVVCRVNDRPASDETITVEGGTPFTEGCETMPSSSAHWALWVKPTADAKWDYAMKSVASLLLKPGQSVGLVFTTGTEAPTPGD
jgi:hypothetical protein